MEGVEAEVEGVGGGQRSVEKGKGGHTMTDVVLLNPLDLCLHIVPTHHKLSGGYVERWTFGSNWLLVWKYCQDSYYDIWWSLRKSIHKMQNTQVRSEFVGGRWSWVCQVQQAP